MKVLILAAGEGKRLRPLTEHNPKTLLSVGNKKIINHILEICEKCGLSDFYILTGHGHNILKTHIEKYASSKPNLSFNYIYNENYNKKGNIYSVYMAKHIFNDDTIIINSDTIFHPNILKNLLKHPEKNVLVVDDNKQLSSEEMKVCIKDRLIKKIDKKIDPKNAHGEYIGVLKIGKHCQNELLQSLETIIAVDDTLYYEDALQHLIDSGVSFYMQSTLNFPAMEIDTLEDLLIADQLICSICP